MANRIYIVPVRNDLTGLGMALSDLKPNAGQKNSIYDGQHQNVYLEHSLDPAGVTVVSGISYVSGPLNTTLTANAVADDTTGGGNDVTAMQATSFGLASYLKDRVHRAGIAAAANGELAFGECNTVAGLIVTDALAGVTLDLARINVHLAATVANTDLTGASGFSKSFGAVEDIMRILSGEVFRLPVLTIIENAAGQFRSLAERQAFVDAQTTAFVAAQGQFYASGGFLMASDSGYRARPSLVRSGSLDLSLASGVLSHYTGNMTILNTSSYAYAAAAVTAWKPRAQTITGGNIAATGTARVLVVYDRAGNVL
jgi:hypothetical protein